MEKGHDSEEKLNKKLSLPRLLAIGKYLCFIVIIAVLGFVAVYHFARALALHPTDTVDTGESIILESEGALTDSRIEGVTDIFQLSEELSSLNSTHAEWTNIGEDKSQRGFFCIAEDTSSECVYNIDQNNICDAGYRLKDFDYIWVDSFSGSFYTVINISGRVVDLSNYYILVRDSSANLASRLIINCYEAEEVLVKNAILTGTLIAPNAHVTYDDTVINGQVYAASSSGMRSAYRDIAFSGYYKMMSALKKADLKNDCIRKAAVSYLKQNFPLVYGDVSDSYIPGEADLLRVKSLEIQGAAADDITSDLQYFEKLQTFSCSDSTIGYIDFSGLKHLNKIGFLRSSLKSVKFGELKSLLKLNIEGCTTDTVDVSKCNELVSLNCGGTHLKELILPEKSKIIYLNCVETDFRGFSESQIASLPELLYLDLQNNPSLGIIDLSVFPKLKKVNITNCGIKELTFEKCPALYYAKCSENNFAKIDISNATALIYFEAYSKVLEEVDATGLFKRGFAALYVYDEVKIVDNDPPPTPPKPPEDILPDETETPSVPETPDASDTPSISETPESTESPDGSDATELPSETDVPENTSDSSETEPADSTHASEETEANETVPAEASAETVTVA